MGCWNHTCAITQLPVLNGEEVVTIWLRQQKTPIDSYCYPDGEWTPIPFALVGQYDDYGSVDHFVDTESLKIFEDYIRYNLDEVEQGENEYHDIAVKKADLDINLIFRSDKEDRLFIQRSAIMHYLENHCAVKHIVIRSHVVKQILDNYTISQYDRVKDPTSPNGYTLNTYDLTYAELLTHIDSYIDALIEFQNSDDVLFKLFPDRLLNNTNNKLATWITHTELTAIRYELNPIIMPLLYQNNRAAVKSILTQTCTVMWLNAFMSETRLNWHPQFGAGSQDADMQPYEILRDALQAGIDEIKNYFEEDEEDEEDE